MTTFTDFGVTRDGKTVVIGLTSDETVDAIYLLDGERMKGSATYWQDYLYKIPVGGKEYRGSVTEAQVKKATGEGIGGKLLFAVADVGGTLTIVATFHSEPLYHDLMEAAMTMDRECAPPAWFVDRFLRFKAVEAALEAGHWTLATKYWDEFMSRGERAGMGGHGRAGGCGCHA